MKKKKYYKFFFFILILGLIGVIIHVFTVLAFNINVFEKKYTRNELVCNFINNENNFKNLINYFQEVIPLEQTKIHQISFGLGKDNDHVSIILYPLIISASSRIIGGENLKKKSLKYNEVLKELGWNNETVGILINLLSKTNCDVIRNVNHHGGCIFQIYPYQNGFNSFSYNIFENPLSDSLVHIYGRSLSNSDFGKRVTLVYTSIL